MNRLRTLIAGALACAALIALTANHLDSPGPSYDELHQAPAAFSYVGSNPKLFTRAFRRIPILNMPYSGAIKSNVYGLLLRYVDPTFSVVGWRRLGIAFVAAALLCFLLTAGRWLPWVSTCVFLCLFLSDVSVILLTRHDGGPTALAQALRLVFLALWFSIALDEPSGGKLALAGLVVGLSLWEKVSSVVLLVPLAILLLTATRRRTRDWLAAGLGLFAGALPLLAANVASYAAGKGLISLRDARPAHDPIGFPGAARYAYDFLSLGKGRAIQAGVFGAAQDLQLERVEAVLMGMLLAGVCVAVLRLGRSDRLLTLAGALAGSYAGVAGALSVFPRGTSEHHWIIGTPFQYAAIALALAALTRHAAPRRLCLAACVCLVAIRAPALVEVEKAFASGQSSRGHAPAFSRLVRLAATKSADAIFVASDWGSATQIYCGSNGRDDTVFEPFWSPSPERTVAEIAANTRKSTIYVVTTGLGPPYLASASSAALEATTALPGWESVALDPEFSDLGPIRVRKLTRRSE